MTFALFASNENFIGRPSKKSKFASEVNVEVTFKPDVVRSASLSESQTQSLLFTVTFY